MKAEEHEDLQARLQATEDERTSRLMARMQPQDLPAFAAELPTLQKQVPQRNPWEDTCWQAEQQFIQDLFQAVPRLSTHHEQVLEEWRAARVRLQSIYDDLAAHYDDPARWD